MIGGKKSIAEKIVYSALDKAVNQLGFNPEEKTIDVFEKIIENVQPKRTVVGRRFGGTTYSVPKEIQAEKRPLIAISIIVKKARQLAEDPKRKAGKSLDDILTHIFVHSYNGTGPAVEEKESLQKTADANETFSHFLR
jgi:small subunit ribosomal protein S7